MSDEQDGVLLTDEDREILEKEKKDKIAQEDVAKSISAIMGLLEAIAKIPEKNDGRKRGELDMDPRVRALLEKVLVEIGKIQKITLENPGANMPGVVDFITAAATKTKESRQQTLEMMHKEPFTYNNKDYFSLSEFEKAIKDEMELALKLKFEDIKEFLGNVSEWYKEDKPSFEELKKLARSGNPDDHDKVIKHYAKSLVVHSAEKFATELLKKNLEERRELLFDRWENETGNRVETSGEVIKGVEELRENGLANESHENMFDDAISCQNGEEFVQEAIFLNEKRERDIKETGKILRENGISEEKVPAMIKQVARDMQEATGMSDEKVEEIKNAALEKYAVEREEVAVEMEEVAVERAGVAVEREGELVEKEGEKEKEEIISQMIKELSVQLKVPFDEGSSLDAFLDKIDKSGLEKGSDMELTYSELVEICQENNQREIPVSVGKEARDIMAGLRVKPDKAQEVDKKSVQFAQNRGSEGHGR